jgi:hypothetical protein
VINNIVYLKSLGRKMKLKTSLSALVLVLLLINASLVHAQGSPCDTGFPDTDGNCPLDTWVIVLVVAASLFAALRLYRRGKLTT